jgi:hypothetical protein
MNEATCIQCGWIGTPIQTEDLGAGLEWCCPQCQTWQHAEPSGEQDEYQEQETV